MARKGKIISMLLVLVLLTASFAASFNELDRVFVYLNGRLAGTWRATENKLVHIDNIVEGDTLTFIARTDLGGLGNSSIDVKDNNGSTVENIQSPASSEGAATFVYVFHLKKIDTKKVSSLQVFLNADPARNLPPPTIASISFRKKLGMKKLICLLLLIGGMPSSGHTQFACSGLDRVDIYLNSKLIATATPAELPTVKLITFSRPDTLMFQAHTNWEGLHNSTLDIKTEYGELIDHVNGNSNGYEATFIYIFNRTNLEDPNLKSFDVFINLLCERDVAPEQICTVNIAAH